MQCKLIHRSCEKRSARAVGSTHDEWHGRIRHIGIAVFVDEGAVDVNPAHARKDRAAGTRGAEGGRHVRPLPHGDRAAFQARGIRACAQLPEAIGSDPQTVAFQGGGGFITRGENAPRRAQRRVTAHPCGNGEVVGIQRCIEWHDDALAGAIELCAAGGAGIAAQCGINAGRIRSAACSAIDGKQTCCGGFHFACCPIPARFIKVPGDHRIIHRQIRREVGASNHRNRRVSRLEPADGEMIIPRAILHQGLNVIALSRLQGDHRRSLLLIPRPGERRCPPRLAGDFHCVGGIRIGAELQARFVIAGDEELILAGDRHVEKAAQALAGFVVPVLGCIKRSKHVAPVWI